MKWLTQMGFTCACDIDPVYGIHVATTTTFFSDGSTCTGAPGGCANQVMQGSWSNMVPWNLVDPNANSGYGQGAGTSFPGTGQLNGQTPIGIWSVNNPFSSTYGGNDFGEPYIWFTQHNWVNNDPSQGCVPNPANCITPTFEPNMIVNCCDPSERYVLDPTAPSPFSSTPPIYDQLTVPYTTSTLGVGIVNYQEAFAAHLYIDGGIGWLTSPPTSPKCWHLVNDPTPFGPTALSASIMNIGKRPSCAELNTAWLASNPIGVDTECCTQEVQIDCETPFAKLAKLTSKLDKFTTWKNKSLGK